MTIKLLAYYGAFPPGSLLTLDSATEAAMIADNQATATLTGGVVYEPPGNSPPAWPSDLTALEVAAVQALIAQGNGYEPTIGSSVTQRITLDEGSDVDHAEVILTFNCGPAGDIAIASERLAAADSRADVVKTAITGATANGALLSFSLPDGLTSLYVARKGESAYTLAAGATATAAQAVAALWSGTLALRYATVNIGNSYVGGGSNKRYRDLIVTGYVGV